jgi:hypothetical protein
MAGSDLGNVAERDVGDGTYSVLSALLKTHSSLQIFGLIQPRKSEYIMKNQNISEKESIIDIFE